MLEDLNKVSTGVKALKEGFNKRVREAAQNELKPALKSALLELKEVVPQINKIEWTQYTPYFNDGEPCEFMINDIYFFHRDLPIITPENQKKYNITEEDARDEFCTEELDNTVSVYSFNRADFEKDLKNPDRYTWEPYSWVREGKLTIDQVEYLANFTRAMNDLEEALEIAFGDHAKIEINVDTGDIDVEEYEHE